VSLESKILRKAEDLGIDKCGIIKPEAMLDYADRLRERMERIPNGEALYGRLMGFADIRERFPWAKSIVVAVLFYGHYALPKNTSGRYGKFFLTDSRFNQDSPERKKITALGIFLNGLGLQTESSEHPGITAMRWAAYKAGLGVIRRNNFFYTEKGSWVNIVAWATDAEMELIGDHAVPPCPGNCDKCVGACPTKSLSDPYVMNMATCVSSLSTSNDTDVYDDETNRRMGAWMYGCDACQDICPMNKGKWKSYDAFPGLREIGGLLSPENILSMSYAEIERLLMPKFFYIKKESLWRWKLDALNALANDGALDKSAYIEEMLRDEHEIVREKAAWALEKIKLRAALG
jgi:epoxyqueuosine reductase